MRTLLRFSGLALVLTTTSCMPGEGFRTGLIRTLASSINQVEILPVTAPDATASPSPTPVPTHTAAPLPVPRPLPTLPPLPAPLPTASPKPTPVPTTTPSPLPPSGPVACKAGPAIQGITDITRTSLTVVFHGENVIGIRFDILRADQTVVATGNIQPQSSTLHLSYSSVAPGDYTLVLNGTNCSGSSRLAFTIPAVTLPLPTRTSPPNSMQCTPIAEPFVETISNRCDPNQRVTKTLMEVAMGKEIWSDGKSHEDRRFDTASIPAVGVTLLDMPKLRFMMDSWGDMGGTSISIPIGWDSIRPTPDRYVWDPIDWILDYAACKKMKIVFKVMTDALGPYHVPDHNGGTPAGRAYRYPDSERHLDENGEAASDQALSFSSGLWDTNVKNWFIEVAEHVKGRGRLGVIHYAIEVLTQEHEFGYGISHKRGDYSGMEVRAWKNWLAERYGSRIPYADQNPPLGVSSNGKGRDWFIFRTKRLQRVSKIFANVFNSYGVKTVIDSGSFMDAISSRNTWAVPVSPEAFGVDGLKQNPGVDYPNDLQSKTLSCNGKWSSMEWTWSETSKEAGLARFINEFNQSVDNGVNDLSFAFLAPTQNPGTDGSSTLDYSPTPVLSQIVASMKASGHWNKKQQCANPNPYVISIGVQNALENNGYHHRGAEVTRAIAERGRANVCVKIIDDINLGL